MSVEQSQESNLPHQFYQEQITMLNEMLLESATNLALTQDIVSFYRNRLFPFTVGAIKDVFDGVEHVRKTLPEKLQKFIRCDKIYIVLAEDIDDSSAHSLDPIPLRKAYEEGKIVKHHSYEIYKLTIPDTNEGLGLLVIDGQKPEHKDQENLAEVVGLLGSLIYVASQITVAKRLVGDNLVYFSKKPKLLDPELEAQEKEVSILSIDVVGYSGFAEKNPKIKKRINGFVKTVQTILRQQGSRMTQRAGDGVWSVFNIPEDLPHYYSKTLEAAAMIKAGLIEDNERSVRAGEESLGFRIGLHGGPAEVGFSGILSDMEYVALGHSPNVASRIQGLAKPNSIYASEKFVQKCRQEGCKFESIEIAEDKEQVLKLKGMEEHIKIHEIISVSGINI